MTVKATGKQWYWSYAYPDSKFEFNSLMLQDKDRKPDQPRLLAVDNEMVVPVNKVIRVQVIGADVIHAFAVPSFGIKIDAVPGRLNETWFKATREGIYYGQCSELCGKDHAYMPIAVRVVSDKRLRGLARAGEEEVCRRPTARGRPGRRHGGIGRTDQRATAARFEGYDDGNGTRRTRRPRTRRSRASHPDRVAPLRVFDQPQGHRHDVPGVRDGRRRDRRRMSIAMRMELQDPGLQIFHDAHSSTCSPPRTA